MIIPLFFREVVLRILLTSNAAIFCIKAPDVFHSPDDWWRIHWFESFLPLVIILHHVLRLWQRRWWWVSAEGFTSFMEVIAVCFLPFHEIHLYDDWLLWQTNGIGTPYYLLHRGLSFVIVVSSLLSFVPLLGDIIDNRGTILRNPYDFSMGLRPSGSQWSSIFGTFTTKKRFSTDNILIRCLRGGIAILSLLGMLGLVIYASIWQPLQWSNHPGVKFFQVPLQGSDTEDLGTGLHHALQLPASVFNLEWPLKAILSIPRTVTDSKNNPTMRLKASRDYSLLSDLDRDPQVPLPLEEPFCDKTQVWSRVANSINCGSIYLPMSDIMLKILFTITFPAAFDNTVPLAVYLILQPPAGPTEDILATVQPIMVIPGWNLLAMGSISVKERFMSLGAATAGLPQYRRFPVIGAHTIYPDLSNPSRMDNKTATLQMIVSLHQFIEVEQEYLEGSALNGLALIGGIWTLVNGVFAAIFGSTLLLVLFGIKPLSIYGLLHLWPGRGSLVDVGYTLSSEERDRIIGILKEHLLDIDEDKDTVPDHGPGARRRSPHSGAEGPRRSPVDMTHV